MARRGAESYQRVVRAPLLSARCAVQNQRNNCTPPFRSAEKSARTNAMLRDSVEATKLSFSTGSAALANRSVLAPACSRFVLACGEEEPQPQLPKSAFSHVSVMYQSSIGRIRATGLVIHLLCMVSILFSAHTVALMRLFATCAHAHDRGTRLGERAVDSSG